MIPVGEAEYCAMFRDQFQAVFHRGLLEFGRSDLLPVDTIEFSGHKVPLTTEEYRQVQFELLSRATRAVEQHGPINLAEWIPGQLYQILQLLSPPKGATHRISLIDRVRKIVRFERVGQ